MRGEIDIAGMLKELCARHNARRQREHLVLERDLVGQLLAQARRAATTTRCLGRMARPAKDRQHLVRLARELRDGACAVLRYADRRISAFDRADSVIRTLASKDYWDGVWATQLRRPAVLSVMTAEALLGLDQLLEGETAMKEASVEGAFLLTLQQLLALTARGLDVDLRRFAAWQSIATEETESRLAWDEACDAKGMWRP